MEYNLKVGNEDINIKTEPDNKEDSFSAIIDGKKSEVKYKRVSANQIILAIDGKNHTVYVSEGEFIIDGRPLLIADNDKKKSRKKGNGTSNIEPSIVTPPMPSVVVKVEVKEGDILEKGVPVVICSAMKMETPLKSPFKGEVVKINVKEGDKVMPGDILVDIEEIIDREGE